MPTDNYEYAAENDLARMYHADEYTLRHLAVHLHEAGQHEKLYKLLVGNKAWMEAKSTRFNSDSEYMLDLQLAIDNFANELTAGQLLLLVQLHTARHLVNIQVDLYTDIDLETLVALGREQQAIGNARLRHDAERRCEGLITICRALKKKEQANIALLNEARKFAELIEDKIKRANNLCLIAQGFAAEGCNTETDAIFSQVLNIVETIGDKEERKVLRFTGVTIASMPNTESSSTFAEIQEQPIIESIKSKDTLSELLLAIVVALVRTQRSDQAQKVVTQIKRVDAQVDALYMIAKAYLEKGSKLEGEALFSEARKLIQKIKSDSMKAYKLCTIAQFYHSSEHEKEAAEIFKEILQLVTRIAATGVNSAQMLRGFELGRNQSIDRLNAITCLKNLCEIAVALTALERTAEATNTFAAAVNLIATIPEPDPDTELQLEDLPDMYDEHFVGNRVVSSTPVFARRIDALLALAEAFAQAEYFVDALETAMQIKKSDVQIAALCSIAEILVQKGNLEDARGIAAKIDQPDLARNVFYKIAEALVRAERFSEAREIAASFGEVNLQVSILSKIAESMASLGQSAEAEVVFVEMQKVALTRIDPEAWTHAMVSVADILAQKGYFTVARRVVEGVTNSGMRIEGQRAIAEALAYAGRVTEADNAFREAEKWAIEEKEPYLQAAALRILAKALARTGRQAQADAQFTEAQRIALLIENPGLRADALLFIAEALVETGREKNADAVFTETRKAAKEVWYPPSQLYLLCMIAESLSRTGREKDADETFYEVMTYINLESPPYSTVRVSLVEALARTGRLDLAKRIASVIRNDPINPNNPMRALRTVARELAFAGRYQEISDVLAIIEDPYYIALTFSDIAEPIARDKQAMEDTAFSLAIKAANEILDHNGRAEVLSYIAVVLARVGRFDEAKEVLACVNKENFVSSALRHIADLQVIAGNFGEGLSNVETSSLERLLILFVRWSSAWEKIEVGLSVKVLYEAIRIIGWRRPDWKLIHDLITAESRPWEGCL